MSGAIDWAAGEAAPKADTPKQTAGGAPVIDWAASEAAPRDPAAPTSDIVKKVGLVGSGIGNATASALGMPVDIANWGLRQVGLGVDEPFGGSAVIRRGINRIAGTPKGMKPTTFGDHVAVGIGEGIGSTLIPAAGAEVALARGLGPVAGSVANALKGTSTGSNIAMGAGSGAGQAAAEELVPDAAKPYAGVAGSLLGGVAGLGVAGGANAMRTAWNDRQAGGPSSAVKRQAADILLGNASDRAAVRGALANAPEEIVPGSKPTLGQLTNDGGIMERENYARQNDPRFRELANDQNAARVGALKPLAAEDASAQSAGSFFTKRLDDIHATYEDVVAQHQKKLDAEANAMGGETLPDVNGQVVQQAVADRYAPQRNLAGLAEDQAAANQSRTLEQMGGEGAATDAATARQTYGEQQRGFVQGAATEVKKAMDDLWTVARRNGDISFSPDPAVEAVNRAKGKGYFSEQGGDKLLPEESRLMDVIGAWKGPVDHEALTSAYTNVNGLIAELERTGGSRRSIRRLGEMKSGINASMEQAIDARVSAENAAVVAGTLAPENTLEAALRQDSRGLAGDGANSSAGQRQSAGVADGAASPVGDVPAGGTTDARGPVGNAGESPQGRGVSEPASDVAPAPRSEPVAPSGPAAAGDGRPGLENISNHTFGNVTSELESKLARAPDGATHVRLNTTAAERAELRAGGVEIADDGMLSISEANRLSADRARRIAAPTQPRAAAPPNDIALRVLEQKLKLSQAQDARFGGEVSEKTKYIQAQIERVRSNLEEAEAAYAARSEPVSPRRAEAERQWDQVTGKPAASGEPPPTAPQPTPVASDAMERTATARAATRDYKQTYTEGVTGDVLERGSYGGPPPVSDAQVPGKYFKPGPTGVDAANAYNTATRGTPEARAAWGEHAAFDLRQAAVNPDGTLNLAKYQTWLKNHNDALSVYPEVAERFATAAKAQEQLNGIRTARAEIEKQFAAASGASPADAMAKYWRSGPSGSASIRDFRLQTNGAPEAMDALADHAAYTLRQVAMPNGEFKPGAYEAWQRRFGPALSEIPEVAERFASVAKAKEELMAAIGRQKQAIKDYEASAARFWLRDNQDIGKALGSGQAVSIFTDMMAQVAKDPAAREGIRRAVLDHILERFVGNVEAGNTGTNRIKSDGFQTFIRLKGAALEKVFTPDQMQVLRAVAEDLQRSNRTVAGSAPLIGPGTARDIAAGVKFGVKAPSLLSQVVSGALKLGSAGAGHAATGGLGGALIGSKIADGATGFFAARRAAKVETIKGLIADSILDVHQARLLMQHATPENMPSVLQRLSSRMLQGTASYEQRRPAPVAASKPPQQPRQAAPVPVAPPPMPIRTPGLPGAVAQPRSAGLGTFQPASAAQQGVAQANEIWRRAGH